MDRRIAVRAIIIHRGKLLCVKLKSVVRDNPENTYWCVPGGGLEKHETLPAGLEREMIEETGVKPKIGNLLYIQQYRDKKREYLEFLFYVTNFQDYLGIDLSQTSHGVIEISEIKFLDPQASNILPKFLTSEPLEQKITTSGPPSFFYYL